MNKKPFHESIVDTINNCILTDVPTLAGLIKATKIPQNHDIIIVAWTKRMAEFGLNNCGVTKSILKDKAFANYEQTLDSAKTLEKAIELAFTYMPLTSKCWGPKTRIILKRNSIPKSGTSAEIYVMDAQIDGKVLFTAYWREGKQSYELTAAKGVDMAFWSTMW